MEWVASGSLRMTGTSKGSAWFTEGIPVQPGMGIQFEIADVNDHWMIGFDRTPGQWTYVAEYPDYSWYTGGNQDMFTWSSDGTIPNVRQSACTLYNTDPTGKIARMIITSNKEVQMIYDGIICYTSPVVTASKLYIRVGNPGYDASHSPTLVQNTVLLRNLEILACATSGTTVATVAGATPSATEACADKCTPTGGHGSALCTESYCDSYKVGGWLRARCTPGASGH